MNQTFTARYTKLNTAQKQAVDTIEGPVMVIAGPGTGKTELLSMRVANILKKTDILPGNILCLTFTESGATAMRQRLVSLMGATAYNVAIHTFHSFGSEVINSNPDFFYHGAHFRPADELSSYEILAGIFEKLPHDNPLSSQMNGEFTQLRDTQMVISELKRSGLTPDELLKILDHNDGFMEYAEPLLQKAFSDTIRSIKALSKLEPLIGQLGKYTVAPIEVVGYTSLARLCQEQLEEALEDAQEQGKTTPITTWRNRWLEKAADGSFIMKDRSRARKLRAVAHIYYEYLVAMQANTLYDFDDMILRVVHALEVFPELKLGLQEQYQYILVDEFQDTNGAQLRILLSLSDAESNNGRPNILVVGDDDQAIYSFQGAELSNILTFRDQFRDPAVIILTDNYRSAAPILTAAQAVIRQGEDRLENRLEAVNKTLTPHASTTRSRVEVVELSDKAQEYRWIVESIAERLKAGQSARTIAVLTRNHREMTHLLPYFHHAGIEVNYERRDNILDLPPIVALEQLGRVLVNIADQQFDALSAQLPELLAHPAWRIPPIELWRIGLEAHSSRRHWVEVMLESKGVVKDIIEWLVVTAHHSVHMTLEESLDVLLGVTEPQVPEDDTIDPASAPQQAAEGYASPLRSFFFPHDALEKSANQYITYLHSLQEIRRGLRNYRPEEPLHLKDFIAFIDLHRKTGATITSPRAAAKDVEGVCLMTAHKSKGLEFETVFVANATHTTWGSGARKRGRSISYPANLPLAPAGETNDERLRLFFVAMTRAKRELLISYATQDLSHKATLKADFLNDELATTQTIEATSSPAQQINAAEHRWYEQVLAVDDGDLKKLLAPVLERYKLSATHLNNFIDVTSGGPQAFLLQNLLRFPQAMSPSAAYGSAVHKTLQRAHAHLSATGSRRPVEDILHDYEAALAEQRLNARDHEYYSQRGSDILQSFLAARYESFSENALPERDFAHQGAVIEDAHLTGKLDLMLIDEPARSITVIDYKTGKAARRWQGTSDFEKIKLHKYKQQLMFYKLLVENSRDYGGRYHVDSGALEFVEPTSDGTIIQLETQYDEAELLRFKQLLVVVWRHIQALDFPDTTTYEATYKGLLSFEDDLLEKY